MMFATMKPSAALLLLTIAAPAFSQGTSTATPKPVVHHTSTTAAKPTAKPCDIPPCAPLAATIPKVEGTTKGLFALKYIDTSEGSGPEAVTTN
jgi:hypothetical protein